MEPVEWIPALAVLAIGAVAGLALAWRAKRVWRTETPVVPVDRALEIRDLRAEVETRVAQLRELHDLGVAGDRTRLERDAALALRNLERAERAVVPVPAERATEPLPARPPGTATRGFLWGFGSVVAVALLVVFVARTATNREEGGVATGGVAADPTDVQALRRAVEANPADIEMRLDLARSLLVVGDVAGAASETRFVLARFPDHGRALSYESLVRLASGDWNGARAAAERAIAVIPDDPEPRVHLAIIHAQAGDAATAGRVLDDAIARFPADAEALRNVRSQLLGEAPPAAPSGALRVEIELARGEQAHRGGVLFVFVRPAGEDAPPVAVRREAVTAFPARVEITPADLMQGGALPARMRVDVRLDADGVLSTTGPEDRVGAVEDAAAGSVVRVALRSPA